MASVSLPVPSTFRLTPLAQAVGITAPAVYAAITYSYNAIVLPPLLDYTADDNDPRLAKQWLRAYQFGPVFVRPLFLISTVVNGGFAVWNFGRWAYGGAGGAAAAAAGEGRGREEMMLGAGIAYGLAVLVFGVVVPYTLAGMEKRINGAAKWKVQLLAAPSWKGGATSSSGKESKGKEDEKQWVMKEGTHPSAFAHSARPEWRTWAEGATMREIVTKWGEWNAPRVYMGIVSAVASAVGMCLSA